ncbi:hypothetical protein [Nitrosomonas sp.]|uniref:hypothetical protein n=1 Tax=Nitrosomonas sp. TaxID=42353 RepID=UPI00374D31BD
MTLSVATPNLSVSRTTCKLRLQGHIHPAPLPPDGKTNKLLPVLIPCPGETRNRFQ